MPYDIFFCPECKIIQSNYYHKLKNSVLTGDVMCFHMWFKKRISKKNDEY